MNNMLVLKKVLSELLIKYKGDIPEEKIIEIISLPSSKNFVNCVEYLSSKYSNYDELKNSKEYEKMKHIFKKTRVMEFPTLDFFINIPIALAEKFNLKVYRLFNGSHLFEDSKALINMIGVLGLFETDSNVNSRIEKAVKIFFYQTVYGQNSDISNLEGIKKEKHVLYILDDEIWKLIPDEMMPYLFEDVTEDYYRFIKRLRGNFGRKINDFINPSYSDGKIKKNIIKIPDYYEYVLKKIKENGEYHAFTKDIDEYYEIDDSVLLNKRKELLSKFREYELTYGPSDIKAMFLHCDPVYDEELYLYFINHQTEIINSVNSFSKFPLIQHDFKQMMKIYKERGNSLPDHITLIEYLRTLPYNVEFGDEQFAIEARNAGVLKESYDYYASLLKIVRNRFKRVLPNHFGEYSFIGKDGKEYKFQTKILEGTDYLNMLIGESKYTDCCQKADDLGRECLEHASKSIYGGIFVVSIVEDNVAYPLSQSWIWINEQELVLDNIEQTLLLKTTPNGQRKIYEDLIADSIKKATVDIIGASNDELYLFIKQELKKPNDIEDLKRLKEIKERQSIKVVTVGSAYSDIIVRNYFDTIAQRKLNLPKDYGNGYSDAKVRYVVAGSEDAITVEPNYDFIEEPIYRTDRKINKSSLIDMSTYIIKRIGMIDGINLIDYEDFINKYELELSENIICGEDWYIIYRHTSDGINIIKSNMGIPREIDEDKVQEGEFNSSIEYISALNKTNNIKRKRVIK